MEEAVAARRAALDAVREVDPPRLRNVLDRHLNDSSMVPGVLTLLSARAVRPDAERPDDRDGDEWIAETAPDGTTASDRTAEALRRGAGVQLVYEGLRLTRTLVRGDPWPADAAANAPADVDVLAADVLVARGFRLLARTEAAERAVETVREFGRSETDRQNGRESATRSLEANVFELAAIAGATVDGGDVPRGLRHYAVGLARSRPDTPLPSAEDRLPERIEEVLRRVSTPTADGGEENPRPPRRHPPGSANRND